MEMQFKRVTYSLNQITKIKKSCGNTALFYCEKNTLPIRQGIFIYFVCLEVDAASFAFTLLLVPNITKQHSTANKQEMNRECNNAIAKLAFVNTTKIPTIA